MEKVNTVKTKSGWYYISRTRKSGRNPLWVGPFETEEMALEDADINEEKG